MRDASDVTRLGLRTTPGATCLKSRTRHATGDASGMAHAKSCGIRTHHDVRGAARDARGRHVGRTRRYTTPHV